MRFAPIAFENTSQSNILFATSSLIGYYDISSYNSNTNIWYDLSGNNNDITVIGNDLRLTNKGFLFGEGNYLSLPTFSGSSALTMMVWGDVNYSNLNRLSGSLRTQALFNKRVGSNNGFTSTHTFRQSATRDAISWLGQSGVINVNQGFSGAQTGSMNFIAFCSNATTSSQISGSWGNALSSSWNDWLVAPLTSGSVLFPYTQPLLFGSSSDGTYNGTVGIIGIYNTILTNAEMNTNYIAVSASTLY
jgi:hypothetical protein